MLRDGTGRRPPRAGTPVPADDTTVALAGRPLPELDESAVQRLARKRLGLERLRPGLAEAVTAAVAGHDVLAVMPTGYGKSAAGHGRVEDRRFSQGAAVRHRRWGPGTVTDVDGDVVTVLFAEVGYKTVSLELAAGETLVPLD